MNKSIYLCGFMGCGKTTVGKRLASILRCSYADMDSYIEETEGMTISEMFERFGEAYFREKEALAVEALGRTGGVISCGGGAMLSDLNAEKAAGLGVVVYIDTPYELCWARVSGDDSRPIAAANTKQSLFEIYKSRVPKYIAHSAVTVDGSGTPDSIAEQICAKL